MDTQTLQSELLDLLALLHNMNPTHLLTLCRFVHHNKEELMLPQLAELLREATPAHVDRLIELTVAGANAPTQREQEEQGQSSSSRSSEEIDKLPKEMLNAFNILVQLYHLHQLLNKLSILQLMKIFEFVPPVPQVQQLQLLQQLQQLLGQLLPETLVSLHQELEATQGAEQHQVLSQLLQLRKEHFHLYQPLRMLLQLDTEELLGMQEILPKLQPVQMLQLLSLLQLQPFDVLELKRLFQGHSDMDEEGEEGEGIGSSLSASSSGMDIALAQSAPLRAHKSLRIVEQPPEKSVYKRNLKPNPTVQLLETEGNSMETNLYIAPILLRCDTLEEKPNLMTGNKPVKVAPGRVVTFRRLKITSTSHQQGESLFAIKFELRRYHGNEYEILDFVQSNPICVLSHSTQLKPAASSTTASVTEVIPYSGSTMGGTRVAVLGTNFVDSPSARVRFDNTDVMPTFHGPRTLICTTPQHQPGIVSVRVSNDSKVWSPTAASFTYEDRPPPVAQTQAADLRQQYDLGLDIASSICEAAWQGGFDTVKDLGERSPDVGLPDSRGYTALHYAASMGRCDIAAFLLEKGAPADARDHHGCTPLYWACCHGHADAVELLVEHGASPDLANDDGITPLHLAAAFDRLDIAALLVEHGALLNPTAVDAGETPLHRAAALGYASLAAFFIAHGAHVNARDDEGDTPLHYALREGKSPAVVEALALGGADAGARNDDMETPLHVVAQSGNPECVKLLVSHGANVDAKDLLGVTPLHDACYMDHAKVVLALLECGAKVNLRDSANNTALGHCIAGGSEECAAALVLAGGVLPLSLRDDLIVPDNLAGIVARCQPRSGVKASSGDGKQGIARAKQPHDFLHVVSTAAM